MMNHLSCTTFHGEGRPLLVQVCAFGNLNHYLSLDLLKERYPETLAMSGVVLSLLGPLPRLLPIGSGDI
jgi:hypothetical protein